MLVRAFFQAARVCKDACVRLDCFGGARSAGWVCVVDTRKICIAIDAIERKLNIDTNLLTQQIALAAHETHLGQKLRYFFPRAIFRSTSKADSNFEKCAFLTQVGELRLIFSGG